MNFQRNGKILMEKWKKKIEKDRAATVIIIKNVAIHFTAIKQSKNITQIRNCWNVYFRNLTDSSSISIFCENKGTKIRFRVWLQSRIISFQLIYVYLLFWIRTMVQCSIKSHHITFIPIKQDSLSQMRSILIRLFIMMRFYDDQLIGTSFIPNKRLCDQTLILKPKQELKCAF